MASVAVDAGFWNRRRVLLTGHTGFKGAWLALWLHHMGARVTGFALAPQTAPSAYDLFEIGRSVDGSIRDVRNGASVSAVVERSQPEVVFHLASQALVRQSLRDPRSTFDTNIAGVVNLIEALRARPSAAILVNVTSDKVYQHTDAKHAFIESDRLAGSDPYSASKACAELITASYRSTILSGALLRVSSARAGNVIGGGDWAPDRIVPDIVRAVTAEQQVVLRHPYAIRPWQHVLEPLSGYLVLAQRMWEDGSDFDSAWNFGPKAGTQLVTVAELTRDLLAAFGDGLEWLPVNEMQPPEMQFLQIDLSKARDRLGWTNRLTMPEAIQWTAMWYRKWHNGEDSLMFTLSQIEQYERKLAVA